MFFDWVDDMRRWTVDGSDKTHLGLLTVLGAGAVVLGVVMASTTMDLAVVTIEDIPDRFAMVMLPGADGSTVSSAEMEDAVIEFGAFDQGRAKGEEGRTHARLKKAKGTRVSGEKNREIAEQTGILADLNSMEPDLHGTGVESSIEERRRQRKSAMMETGSVPLFGNNGTTSNDRNVADLIGAGSLQTELDTALVDSRQIKVAAYGDNTTLKEGGRGSSGQPSVTVDMAGSSIRLGGTSSRGSGLGGHGTGEMLGGLGTRGRGHGGSGYGLSGGPGGHSFTAGLPDPWIDPAGEFVGDVSENGKYPARPGQDSGSPDIALSTDDLPILDPALQAFYDRTRGVEGLTYRSPTGYWANTYIPIDPVMRRLDVRVRSMGHSYLESRASTMELEDLARRTTQPFDPPGSAALSLYLHASQTATQDPRRLTVQVGIQGAPLHGGQRPAMNVAVVLDLRHKLSASNRALVGALLEELDAQRDLADHFSLTVAGQPGGTVLEPDQFRRGPVLVMTQQLFDDEHPLEGPVLDMGQALAAAGELARGSDDAIPGSSLVVIVTDARPRNHEELKNQAHRLMVSGVPTSIVGVGDEANHTKLQEIALAGQGTHRWISGRGAAEGIVRDELRSASWNVARALRLRIRLAPGVELVDVLGSYPLDEQRTQQVREVEQSIDRKLAKQMGIQSDRGDDEDGIQILIPGFRAGDSHVILLDVVVPGPGPVAEATVRYKDLVYLRNGVARSSLQLDRGERAAGPLERNVTKNLLAYELSRALWQAGEQADDGDIAGATDRLAERHRLLTALSRDVEGYRLDPDILDDLRMLSEYTQLLEESYGHRSNRIQFLSASLHLAGLAKVNPRPAVKGGVR